MVLENIRRVDLTAIVKAVDYTWLKVAHAIGEANGQNSDVFKGLGWNE